MCRKGLNPSSVIVVTKEQMKSLTKDEKFLVALYRTALGKGDPYVECDMYPIGQALGLHDKAISTIVKLLAQINFVKKCEGSFITLTPLGITSIKDRHLY